MPWCDADEKCKRPKEWMNDMEPHYFSGYGYLLHFHPECCPREFDGTDCRKPHPDIIEEAVCYSCGDSEMMLTPVRNSEGVLFFMCLDCQPE